MFVRQYPDFEPAPVGLANWLLIMIGAAAIFLPIVYAYHSLYSI